jgi:hypothetical protein
MPFFTISHQMAVSPRACPGLLDNWPTHKAGTPPEKLSTFQANPIHPLHKTQIA